MSKSTGFMQYRQKSVPYRDADLIWILGGDQNIESDDERAAVDALATGLREGDGGAHLITFHPRGPGLSSLRLHDAPWLDFNMIQSSHGAFDHDNGLFVEHDGYVPLHVTKFVVHKVRDNGIVNG